MLTALRGAGYRGLLRHRHHGPRLLRGPVRRGTEGANAARLLHRRRLRGRMILDSVNARTLAFAGRFRARFDTEASWESTQGFDGAQLAMQAVHAALATEDVQDRRKAREAVMAYPLWLDSAAKTQIGLTGPLWFTPGRIRTQAVWIGRFHSELLESAPLQLIPVTHPDPVEVALGAVFPLDEGRFARLQRVVSTGVLLNKALG